ncbi:hypothetical protein CH294_04855 [Rhodococcus sp. 14-2483-1-1]|uniref:ester cyclase n=1 Tax=Rhodococcus sp. 14-2483-1-1 TaxID=2023148 RepID=UPI000B9BCC86|nr:nuclear transport factor 2 family protein [Rhodococcus sp. 14-2483-1-1]OZF40620.1 hypothetical protein CH294_04855 [Rhodococcus sp. 14-2483-1-1]
MTPHPTDPEFTQAFSKAWTDDPDALVEFFAPEAYYRDMAFEPKYVGREAISKFHRYMLKFAPDSFIEFEDIRAADGRFYGKWRWSGTYGGPLRLRNGKVIDASGKQFTVFGVAICEYGDDGRLTSHEDYWDLVTVLDQVGVTIA